MGGHATRATVVGKPLAVNRSETAEYERRLALREARRREAELTAGWTTPPVGPRPAASNEPDDTTDDGWLSEALDAVTPRGAPDR